MIPTFKESSFEVHSEYKSGWKKGKHHIQWLRALELYAFPSIGDMLIKEIDGPIIRNLLMPIWREKSPTALKVKQCIWLVLEWAYSNGFREMAAPMRSLGRGLPKQNRKVTHFAVMPYEIVPTSFRSLRSRDKCSRLASEFLNLTATRSCEVRRAKWDEVDLLERYGQYRKLE